MWIFSFLCMIRHGYSRWRKWTEWNGVGDNGDRGYRGRYHRKTGRPGMTGIRVGNDRLSGPGPGDKVGAEFGGLGRVRVKVECEVKVYLCDV